MTRPTKSLSKKPIVAAAVGAKTVRATRTKAASTAARIPAHPFGTQTIHRAVNVLRELAAFQQGMRLVDIASALHLESSTTHRIVKGLVSHGMVMQVPNSKYYRLGPLVYELGLAASPFFNLKEICHPTLQRLAEHTGDSVFLVIRSGFDVVCIDRMEGGYPIQARTLDVGSRRPLGVGAGGMALLLGLDDAEIEQVIATNAPRMPQFGMLTVHRLREALEVSRAVGYAINDGDVLAGIGAIGMAIRMGSGRPYAAISIAGISARLKEPRRGELAQLLRKEVRALARRLEESSVSWA